MMEKTLMIILFICSIVMIIVGRVNHWVLHILFGFLTLAMATIILVDRIVIRK